MSSKIEWTDETWNPITGCTPISEGCQNCYAKRMANRLKGRYGYPVDEPFRVTYHKNRMGKPAGWKKPRMIFVCSMGDLFHRDVDIDSMVYPWIMRMVRNTPWHTYLFLTKRPMKMKWVCENLWKPTLPDNLWLGVTAENQKRADERIPILLQIPASMRFVSIEPMLGTVDLDIYLNPVRSEYHINLDWVICGAETGPGARHMDDKWAFDLWRQCKAAHVPFFFKKASKGSVLQWDKREFPSDESVTKIVPFENGDRSVKSKG